MHPITYLTIAALCFVCAYLSELAERESKKWYTDRFMLRASGFFIAVGLVSAVMAFL